MFHKGLLIAALDMMAKNGHDTVIIDVDSTAVSSGIVEIVKEIDQRNMVRAIRIHEHPDVPYKCYAEPRRSKSDRKRDPKWRRK